MGLFKKLFIFLLVILLLYLIYYIFTYKTKEVVKENYEVSTRTYNPNDIFNIVEFKALDFYDDKFWFPVGEYDRRIAKYVKDSQLPGPVGFANQIGIKGMYIGSENSNSDTRQIYFQKVGEMYNYGTKVYDMPAGGVFYDPENKIPIMFIHRINLKNYALQAAVATFNKVDTYYNPVSVYDKLYSINYFYKIHDTVAINDESFNELFNKTQTGFNYAYVDKIRANYSDASYLYHDNTYVNSYHKMLTELLGKNYKNEIENLRLLQDLKIFTDDVPDNINLYPFEPIDASSNLKDLCTGTGHHNQDNLVSKLYPLKAGGSSQNNSYYKYINYVSEDKTFSTNVNSNIKRFFIRDISDNVTSYNDIYGVDDVSGTYSQSTLSVFFKHFYIMNALHAMYVERNFYNDSRYILPDISKSPDTPFKKSETYNYKKTPLVKNFNNLFLDYPDYIEKNVFPIINYNSSSGLFENGETFDMINDVGKIESLIDNGTKTDPTSEKQLVNYTKFPVSKNYRYTDYHSAIEMVLSKTDLYGPGIPNDDYKETIEYKTAGKNLTDAYLNRAIRRFLRRQPWQKFTNSIPIDANGVQIGKATFDSMPIEIVETNWGMPAASFAFGDYGKITLNNIYDLLPDQLATVDTGSRNLQSTLKMVYIKILNKISFVGPPLAEVASGTKSDEELLSKMPPGYIGAYIGGFGVIANEYFANLNNRSSYITANDTDYPEIDRASALWFNHVIEYGFQSNIAKIKLHDISKDYSAKTGTQVVNYAAAVKNMTGHKRFYEYYLSDPNLNSRLVADNSGNAIPYDSSMNLDNYINSQLDIIKKLSTPAPAPQVSDPYDVYIKRYNKMYKTDIFSVYTTLSSLIVKDIEKINVMESFFNAFKQLMEKNKAAEHNIVNKRVTKVSVVVSGDNNYNDLLFSYLNEQTTYYCSNSISNDVVASSNFDENFRWPEKMKSKMESYNVVYKNYNIVPVMVAYDGLDSTINEFTISDGYSDGVYDSRVEPVNLVFAKYNNDKPPSYSTIEDDFLFFIDPASIVNAYTYDYKINKDVSKDDYTTLYSDEVPDAVRNLIKSEATWNKVMSNYFKLLNINYSPSEIGQYISDNLNESLIFKTGSNIDFQVQPNNKPDASLSYNVSYGEERPKNPNEPYTTHTYQYDNLYSNGDEVETEKMIRTIVIEDSPVINSVINYTIPRNRHSDYFDPYNYSSVITRFLNSNKIPSNISQVDNFYILDMYYLLSFVFQTNFNSNYNVNTNFNINRISNLLKYDINNVVNIKANTDPLSQDNFSKLLLNEKIDAFFKKIGETYNNFSELYPSGKDNYPFVPVDSRDYFAFFGYEDMLYNDIVTTYSNFYGNSLVQLDPSYTNLIIYSYTLNYTTQINCLIEIYNNDLIYTVSPIFDQIKTIIDCVSEMSNYYYDSDSENFLTFKYYDTSKFKDVRMSYLPDVENFANFKINYSKSLDILNRGIIFDISGYLNDPSYSKDNVKADIANTVDYPSRQTGFLNLLMNYHNLALNLILRVFHYYNKYKNLLTKYPVKNIVSTFDTEGDLFKIFEPYNYTIDVFTNATMKTINLDNFNTDDILNPGNNAAKKMVTVEGYELNITAFIKNYVNYYNEKLCPLLYKHIRYNMAIQNYSLANSNHFVYNGQQFTPGTESAPGVNRSSHENLNIQKGELIKETTILLNNMLKTVKNGQQQLSYIYNKYDYIKKSKVPYIDTNKHLDYTDKTFSMFTTAITNYINTVFYFEKSMLYGCFENDVNAGVFDSMDLDYVKKNSQKTPFVIGNVNNYDGSGNISQYGAMINCINDTIAYNSANKANYDIVTIKPFDTSKTGGDVDMYTCYAGYSSSFEKSSFVDRSLLSIDKCSVNYTDASGNLNTDLNKNLTENTIIYKISNQSLDTSNVLHLGCYKRNIPSAGVFNTLPHFINTLSAVHLDKTPDIIAERANKQVDDYNEAMGTDYDIFGLTLNPYDNNNIDIYAGTYGFDAKNALLEKADPYGETCNIYFPGSDNFIIFQRRDKAINPCTPVEVTNLQSYNEKLTAYLNKNIDTQLKTVLNIGPEIDILDGLLPIKFAVSAIANSKQYNGLSVDPINGSMNSPSASPDDDVGGNSKTRICNLKLTLKEGPPGVKGNVGIDGQKGTNTVGPPGDRGNAGYWGTSR